jgi:hypothetical protein
VQTDSAKLNAESNACDKADDFMVKKRKEDLVD